MYQGKIAKLKNKFSATGKIDIQSYLFSKLFFTEFVKYIKLLSQDNIFKKTTACKFNSHNDLKINTVRFFNFSEKQVKNINCIMLLNPDAYLSIRNHHSNSSKLNF